MKSPAWPVIRVCAIALAVFPFGTVSVAKLQVRHVTPGKMAYVLPAFDQDPVRAHTSARLFAERVSKLLRERYPSRVENLKVRFSFGQNKRGELGFTIIWSCMITPTAHKPEDADYYFASRGTIRIDRNLAVAETIENAREMMNLFHQNYRNFHDLGMFSASTTDSNGRTWYLEERFIGARKY